MPRRGVSSPNVSIARGCLYLVTVWVYAAFPVLALYSSTLPTFPATTFEREGMSAAGLRERFNVFAAIRAPGRPVTMPHGMTLVNLYRTVFRDVFGAAVTMLPDRTILTPFSAPYRFELVGVEPL